MYMNIYIYIYAYIYAYRYAHTYIYDYSSICVPKYHEMYCMRFFIVIFDVFSFCSSSLGKVLTRATVDIPVLRTFI